MRPVVTQGVIGQGGGIATFVEMQPEDAPRVDIFDDRAGTQGDAGCGRCAHIGSCQGASQRGLL